MNQAAVKHIVNNLYGKLESIAKKKAHQFKVEDIHKFRTTYKKLRAFFRLASQQQEKEKQVALSKKTRDCYHILGEIRDLQLQQKRVSKLFVLADRKPVAYLDLIKKEIFTHKSDLHKIDVAKTLGKTRKKTNAGMPKKISLDAYKNFVQKKWVDIDALILSGKFSDDNIHTIRKDLKDIFYTRKSYTGVGARRSNHDLRNLKDKKHFDQFLNELGEYQDCCRSIELVKRSLNNKLIQNEQALLEQVKKRWIREKASLKSKLIRKIKSGIGLHQKKTRAKQPQVT